MEHVKDCKLTGSISEDTNVTSFRRRRLLGVHRPSDTMTADSSLSLVAAVTFLDSPADPFVAMRRSEDERSGKRTFLALVSRIARHRVYHRPRRGALSLAGSGRPSSPSRQASLPVVLRRAALRHGALFLRSRKRDVLVLVLAPSKSACPLCVCASLFRPTWVPG